MEQNAINTRQQKFLFMEKRKNSPCRDAHGRLGSALCKFMLLLDLSSVHQIEECLQLLPTCEVDTECFCFCQWVIGDY